jgi:hypothetical protein
VSEQADITLVERDFDSFFEVPFLVYPSTSPWVAMLKSDLRDLLDTKKNPHWKVAEGTYFTALRNGQPVGRLLVHVHHAANVRFSEKACSFGFFDAIDDVEVARALFTRAEVWGKERGLSLMRGNMNLTANQEIGVLTGGDHEAPFVAQMFQPAHISTLLERLGYVAKMPMSTFVQDDIKRLDPESLLLDKHRGLLSDPDYTWRPFRMNAFDDDVEIVRGLLNDAMDKNPLFVPMTPEEARFQLGPMEQIMDPALTRIAEYKGEPVAVTICIPDPNPLLKKMRSRLNPWSLLQFLWGRRRLRRASVIIILVRRDFHGKGIIGVLNRDLVKALQVGGYTAVGGTWISDTNKPSLRQIELLGMRPMHRLALFEKPL